MITSHSIISLSLVHLFKKQLPEISLSWLGVRRERESDGGKVRLYSVYIQMCMYSVSAYTKIYRE